MKFIDDQKISEIIGELKKSDKRLLTNCFVSFSSEEKPICADFSDKTLLIIDEDHGVNRLYFYTVDFDDMDQLVNQCLEDKEYVIEIVGREKELYKSELAKMGFDILKVQTRISTRDITHALDENQQLLEYVDTTIGQKPAKSDIHELNELMWELFDNRIGHLLSDEEVWEVAQKDEILINKEDGKVVSILQTVTNPKKLYINFIINQAERKSIHAIMINKINEYIAQGGKYVYAWADEDNYASLKFHLKYGMKPDGMWNTVYVRKKVQK